MCAPASIGTTLIFGTSDRSFKSRLTLGPSLIASRLLQVTRSSSSSHVHFAGDSTRLDPTSFADSDSLLQDGPQHIYNTEVSSSMETMTPYPVTPQTQISHLRHSAARTNPAVAQEATRSMQAADSQQPLLSAPASQESFVSVQSNGSSVVPRLHDSSSNVSQITTYTDPTSPATAASQKHEQKPTPARSEPRRQRTPEGILPNGDCALVSPMSVTSPISSNGAKRTASGHIKNAPMTPNNAMSAGRRSRAESLSSTGSRAGELAASLKARLGYAMVKVQNGWEHKTLDEVERLAAPQASRDGHITSHQPYGQRPTSSGLTNGTSRLSMYEPPHLPSMDGTRSPPSKRHSGTYASFTPQAYAPTNTAPQLQPPADIRPTTTSHRHHAAPTSSQGSHYGHAMSPPRTPMNSQPRRPPTIRTDTQTAEAEREALQALFQLGSPHASQVSRHTNATSQAGSSQASPLRAELTTPRKVAFARSESSDGSLPASSAEGSLHEAWSEARHHHHHR